MIEKLAKFGIPAKKWKRSQKTAFMIENYVERDKLKIHCPDSIEPKIYGNKKHKQAVIVFDEPASEFEETLHVYNYNGYKGQEEERSKEINRTRTFVPFSKFEVIDNGDIHDSYTDVKIKVKTPRRTNCLLVGFDEGNTFICQLPEVVKSVTRAHEVLRPKGISDDAIRVGEWYFEPIGEGLAIKPIGFDCSVRGRVGYCIVA